mmetsp:Transcript_27448/g.42063  ORF Transcript_27448/g.42063 Transcript_27448/m.42063 type:complete len:367 (+) Transcript_27448:93-1193(+)
MNMCISDKIRRRSFLASSEAAALIAQSVENCSERANERRPVTTDSLAIDGIINSKENGKHCVQHNYHDHANDVEGLIIQPPVISKGGVTVPFPMKLHGLLEQIDSVEPELSGIVSWLPHGRSFLVHKPKEFANSVLPRFFQQKKYASFQRQLNLYGFSRITQGADRGSYYHEYFLRAKKFLCRSIIRMKVKGTGARMASNPDAEPNFYVMRPLNHHLKRSLKEEPAASEVPSSSVDPIFSRRRQKRQHTRTTSLFQSDSASILSSSSVKREADNDDIDFVFSNMPFHSLKEETENIRGRRHSLMDRRSSLRQRGVRRSSMTIEVQEDFKREIDTILSKVGTDAVDEDMRCFLEDCLSSQVKGLTAV